MYSIHKRKWNGEKIGIFSINSGWRAFDEDSKGKLLFPITALQKALEDLKDCTCKFVIIHHPLFYFKEFNYFELQTLIHKEFDIIFSGHIHQSEINIYYRYNNGIFAPAASASMSFDKSSIGYTVNHYDYRNKNQVIAIEGRYNEEIGEFINEDQTIITLPCSAEKNNQNKIRSKISSKISVELLNGKDLLLNQNSEEDTEDIFLKVFNNPVIKTRSKSEMSTSDNQSNFDFAKLLTNDANYFIYGNDKSGKTSLLKYIQIKHLKDYSTFGCIPFFLDFKEISLDSKWDIISYMAKYFELSKSKTVELIQKHNFRLLIDNFNPEGYLYDIIDNFLNLYKNVNFIICCDNLTSRTIANYSLGEREYNKLFLHDLTRKEVRQYTNKYLDNKESNDDLIDKVISFCKQLEMPLNYWIISMLLLIHKKSRFDLSKNIFEILDLSVDEILNKKILTLTKSKLNFGQLKRICSKLASFLLRNYSQSTYSASYTQILQFLDEEVQLNIRLTANAYEILTYLLDSGILKIKEDQNITFRLNGIFEYFIALNMDQDTELKDLILKDDTVYLSFKNEIEIYSGLKNGDANFLIDIYYKTYNFFKEINKSFDELGKPDQILHDLVSEENEKDLKQIARRVKAEMPLNEEDRDNFKDEMDSRNINSTITQKRIYDISTITPEIFEKYISILARVYKTMDDINDPAILGEIFDFLLKTYTNFGFFLIKIVKENNGENDIEEKTKENLLILLKNFIPIITQISFSDSIAHYNVEAIILKTIDRLKTEKKANQFHLFMLYFILMDIDGKNIIKYTDDLLSFINEGILRYSVILKLNYYFSFNGHKNKKVAEFLKIKIQEAQMKLDEKTDKSNLQKSLDNKGNINILKK